jgi:hypothetical protein
VARGRLARLPSLHMIEFHESFQHWFSRPVSVFRRAYST